MVSSSLSMFKKPETVNRTLEKIAHGHFKKGVKAYQYPIAGHSLFLTFKFCLGTAWDPPTERAWHRIFSHILKEIVRVAVIDEKAGEIVEQKDDSKPGQVVKPVADAAVSETPAAEIIATPVQEITATAANDATTTA
jgi:hemoglobin-like flavoprotein